MKVGDLVKAIPGKHPAGVLGIIVDTWHHPNNCGSGFRVHFPGTAHRSDSHTDMHVCFETQLEVIHDSR